MKQARAEHVHFVLKFQQTTGPVMAKGLEDTVFYIYNRLAALNEVGGEPQRFGMRVGGISSAKRGAAGALAGDAPRHFHPRHETERRCARADGGDLGDSRCLAAFVRPLAHPQPALETARWTKAKRLMPTRNIYSTKLCSGPGRCSRFSS